MWLFLFLLLLLLLSLRGFSFSLSISGNIAVAVVVVVVIILLRFFNRFAQLFPSFYLSCSPLYLRLSFLVKLLLTHCNAQ